MKNTKCKYSAKRLYGLFAFLLLVNTFCFSQYWERSIGNPDSFEYIMDVDEFYDKGYVLGTELIDEISPNQQNYVQSAIIYKTDVNGNILWYRNLRKDQGALRACKGVEDGSMIALFITVNSSYINRILLSRIDQCGNMIWCKEIVDDLDCGFQSGDLEIINNRIVICREIMCNYPDSWFDIVMFDLDGNKICEKPFLFFSEHPLMNSPFINKMLPLPNNEFMLLGRVYYQANPSSPAWLRALFIKFDAEGNEQWVLPFGLKDTIVSFSANCENVVIPQPNNYFAFNVVYKNPLQALLMKFDDFGYESGFVISDIDTLFNDGHSPGFNGAQKLSENRFLNIMTYKLPDVEYQYVSMLTVVDSTINILYDTLVLNSFSLYPLKMTKTFDGKYLTGGFDRSYEDVQAYLNKVSLDPLSFDTMYTAPYTYDSLCPGIIFSDTLYFEDCQQMVGDNDIQYELPTQTPLVVYPNPATEELTVSLGSATHTAAITLTIHTLTGEVQWQGILPPGEQSIRLSVLSWPKGIYLVSGHIGNEVVGREKVVVM